MSTLAIHDYPPPSRAMPLALGAAALLHAFAILGISFDPFLQEMRTPPALEVVLVQNRQLPAPEEADYLAAVAQDGGGQSEAYERPASPFSSKLAHDAEGVAALPIEAASPRQRPAADDRVLTAVFAEDEVPVDSTEQRAQPEPEREDRVLVEENLEIARLAAEINRQQQKFAKRPKKKWLTARTHEASSAEYMYRWVEKVEQVGNLNYPDAARRRQLTGALVLIVGIYKNGEIESVVVEESSGHRVLDDAARRIVELAGPFEPLTGKLGEETDILYIVRTWEFQSSNSVISY